MTLYYLTFAVIVYLFLLISCIWMIINKPENFSNKVLPLLFVLLLPFIGISLYLLNEAVQYSKIEIGHKKQKVLLWTLVVISFILLLVSPYLFMKLVSGNLN